MRYFKIRLTKSLPLTLQQPITLSQATLLIKETTERTSAKTPAIAYIIMQAALVWSKVILEPAKYLTPKMLSPITTPKGKRLLNTKLRMYHLNPFFPF